MKTIIYFIFSLISIIFLIFYSLLRNIFNYQKRQKKVIFGTTPIINNKYWSNALKGVGIPSETFMSGFYSINKKEDFDKYFDDVLPKILRINPINKLFHFFFVWLYIVNNAKVFVMSFDGVIYKKFFWKMERWLFRINGIKTIVIPYGGDSYMYSRTKDKSLQNGLLLSYPDAAKMEKKIEQKVFYWSKYADVVITGIMSADGFPRWDLCLIPFVINTHEWYPKKNYSMNDGYNGVVKILHAPNHRGFKGTYFLIDAVDELIEEGLKIELVLLEKVSNDKIKEIMQEADILADQFVFGYAMNAIEGMASGLPVLSNLEHEVYKNLLCRYSYIKKCPILSTTPENIKENIKLLVTNPTLRKELGQAGREYVEKYHSYETFQYVFKNILKKFSGEDVDLLNLFSPLKSEYLKDKS